MNYFNNCMSTFMVNVMLAHLIDATVSFQIYSHMMKIKFEKSQRNPYPLPLFVWVVSTAILFENFFLPKSFLTN